MALISIVILAVAVYLCFVWTGQQWLLWTLVGVAAVVAQLNNNIWLTRLQTPNERDNPTLRALKKVYQERFGGAEKPLSRKVAEPAVVLVVVAFSAWLGRGNPRGVWLQRGLDALMWFAVVLGLITSLRLQMTQRKIARR